MSPQAFPRSGYHHQRLLWQHDTALHVRAGKLGACENSLAAGRRRNLRSQAGVCNTRLRQAMTRPHAKRAASPDATSCLCAGLDNNVCMPLSRYSVVLLNVYLAGPGALDATVNAHCKSSGSITEGGY